MAFIVETGRGIPHANSLVSVAYADTYFEDRNNAEWPKLTVNAKQAALLQATAYMRGQYEWKGKRLVDNQGTIFPRTGVQDPNGNTPVGVPTCIKEATCELAIRASKGTLLPDPTLDEGGRPVKMKQMRAGPLHKTIEYAGPGEVFDMPRFPAVDNLICPWLLKKSLEFDHGVKVTEANVQGVSNSKMDMIQSNNDRYTGPMNENGKDVGVIDDGLI